jgi:3-hydroxy-3-methylglutaryl CoA synthase
MKSVENDMKKYGIEKIRIYPTALQLDFTALATARGFDVDYMHRELMVECRGLNPVWEDAVTMAVNAAKPLLTDADRAAIGLLIVATETGLDQEKAVSSWVLHHLGLKSSCRHFEVKTACYSGTAALKMALSWLSSGMAREGEKALIITSDESLNSMHKPWEYVLGAGAVAMLVSDSPDFLEIELDKCGVHSHEVTDVIRPLPWLETGNSELSLFSYMEALTSSYENYEAAVGALNFTSYFDYQVYHVPFGGISFRAHKQLMSAFTAASKTEIQEDFNRRVLPSLVYTRQIGATYGGSIFIAMHGLISTVAAVRPGDRIGVYSYGSGSCAEFYSGIVGEKALETAVQAGLPELIANRFPVTVAQYEQMETERDIGRQNADFTPDFGTFVDVYDAAYRDKGLLVYKGSKGYYRTYELS